MSDPLENIEAELSRMQPRGLPDELIKRIDSRLAGRGNRSLSDRLLIASMCSGMLAACVIVVLLLTDARASSPSMSPPLAGGNSSRLMDLRVTLAQADAGWTQGLR